MESAPFLRRLIPLIDTCRHHGVSPDELVRYVNRRARAFPLVEDSITEIERLLYDAGFRQICIFAMSGKWSAMAYFGIEGKFIEGIGDSVPEATYNCLTLTKQKVAEWAKKHPPEKRPSAGRKTSG